jgi:hypothetical protein
MDSKLLHTKKTLPMSAIREFLSSRTIALIGNAESIFDNRFGEEIDQHDVVIRINKGFIKDAGAQGKRTTIWASSYPLSEKEVLSYFAPELSMWMTPKLSVMPRYSDAFLAHVFIHPEEIWNELFHALGETRPTTGAMLINFIVNHTEAESLSLYGFDFFHTKTFYSHKLRTDTPHDFSAEEQLVADLINKKANVTIRGYQFG